MKYSPAVLTAIASFVFVPTASSAVVHFEDLELADNSVVHGDPSQAPFESSGAVFNRTWSTEFDCCPGAWAYSNQTDLTTGGFTNSYSAFAAPNGGGVDGSRNFAVANNLSQGESTIVLPAPSRVLGTYVANTTYGYLAIANGNDGGAGFIKGPFSDGDWFRLEFVGLDEQNQEVGSVPFYLADYRDGQSTVVSEWTWVDLSGLGDRVKHLEFRMDSTDQGQFGMNTPAYFAIDNLNYQIVPEPSGGMAIWLAAVAALATRRRSACSESPLSENGDSGWGTPKGIEKSLLSDNEDANVLIG